MVKVLVTLIKFGQLGCRKVCEKDMLSEEETRRQQKPARLRRQAKETARKKLDSAPCQGHGLS